MQTYPSQRRRVLGPKWRFEPRYSEPIPTIEDRAQTAHHRARPLPWRRPATDHDATLDQRRQAPERLPELGCHQPQQPQPWDVRVHRCRRVRRLSSTRRRLFTRCPPSPACARTSWTCIVKRRVVVSCPAHPPPIVRPADLPLPSRINLCPPCGGAVGTRTVVSPPLQYSVIPSLATPPDHPLLPTLPTPQPRTASFAPAPMRFPCPYPRGSPCAPLAEAPLVPEPSSLLPSI